MTRRPSKLEAFCVAIILIIAVLLLAVVCYDAGVQLFVLHHPDNFVQDVLILILVAIGIRIIYREGKL